MKTTVLMAGIAAALVLTAADVQAKPRGERMDFATLDANSDGQLSMEELQAQGQARFAAADTDGNGSLSAEELTAASEGRRANRIERMMERLDANEDGELSQEELAAAREGRGDRAERMFERADEDGDGLISEEEFEAAKERGRGGRHGGKDDSGNDTDEG